MKKKVLSMIICTTMVVSQASMISTVANADTTGNPSGSTPTDSSTTNGTTGVKNSTTPAAVSVGDSTTPAAASVSNSITTTVAANIIVNKQFTGADGEKVDGIETYKTVQKAIESISANNLEEKIVYIRNGIYKEKLTIDRPYVTLVGESAEHTIITFDDGAGTINRSGNGITTYGTSGSASVTVKSSAKNFQAANITISNSYDESIKSSQAVAMKNESDNSVFVNCRFTGNQDTLYPNKGKQYYYNCFISGDVDFIFGGAQAVFKECEIKSVNREGITPKGYVTAPSTDGTQKYGYLIEDCKLVSNITTPASVYLGRPWHPSSSSGTVNSSAVYKHCYLGAHIAADGWTTMSNSGTLAYPADNAMYEYNNYGPGATSTSTDNRKQLTTEAAANYSVKNVLGGWDPSAVVNKLSSYKVDKDNYNKSEDYDKYMEADDIIDSEEEIAKAEKAFDNVAEQVKWNFTRFGASTSDANNQISIDSINKTVTLTAGTVDGKSAGGKITGSNDGMSYYYTEIEPTENFELSATVKVNYFEKKSPDNQCGFGIMARDTLGLANDASVSPSNMVLLGGYRANIQSVYRTGVTADLSETITMEDTYKFADRPANDGTSVYKLTLKKTNTGYIASVDDGTEKIYYEPKLLEVADGKIYLGFFTARIASITVSNINLVKSEVATDPDGIPAPPKIITPAISVKSSSATGNTNYNLKLKPTVKGNVNVKLNDKEVFNTSADSSSVLTIPTTLMVGDNRFEIVYTPMVTENNTNTNPLPPLPFSVNVKSYGIENGAIYVAPNGTADGDGTIEKPVDINTAIKYIDENQTIKVKGGKYSLASPITIEDTNSGTEKNMKTLESYDGRAIFDFGGVSKGLLWNGSYWNIRGIDVCNTLDNYEGLRLGGSYNVVENVNTYKNGGSGLQISATSSAVPRSEWPKYNKILNCTSYDNKDSSMNNADGFAAKITSGEGNLFKGCISYNNCDDGWDLFTKLESGQIGAVTIEDCIAYGNGTLSDGTDTDGDGNGFKLGGEGIPVKHKLLNSLSFNNNASGISSNSNPAIIVENSIGADNKKYNIDLHYYTGANLEFKLTNNISFRTIAGESDYAIDSVIDDSNYFYDGTKTINKSGKEITKDYFKSVVMPKVIEMDSKGNIIWPDYMTPVNGTGDTGTGDTGTGGTGTGDTGTGDTGTGTGDTGTGGTGTGDTGTGGTGTGDTGTGGTTTGNSSSHHHHSNSSSSSSSSTTSGSTTTSGTESTTTSTSTGNTTNNIINLNNASKEQAKAIEKQVVSNVSVILGSGTQVSATKEVQTSDGNKLTVTALVKDGKATGLVIAAEKTSATTTIQVDTSAEVSAVYKYVPVLNKYIEVTDSVVIDKNTITLPTQANATYVAATEKLATDNVISEGWAKVDNSWYMVDKTGNPLIGWQKDSTGWVYLSQTNAKMETGWKQDSGKWYLLNNNGYMATGWAKTGDKWYYLNSDGSMVSNTTVDGYTIGNDGALV